MSLSLLPPEPPVLPPRRSSLSTPVASKVVFSFPQASNDVIARYQEYLLDSYIPADLSALLAERRPARSEDIHVLQRAAAHANLWVLLDREYQAVIRSRGVDFCTLAAAVHLILARLVSLQTGKSDHSRRTTIQSQNRRTSLRMTGISHPIQKTRMRGCLRNLQISRLARPLAVCSKRHPSCRI